LSYQGFQSAVARYRAHRARQARIRNDDDAMRDLAAQHTDDPLVAKEHNCVAKLTYTKSGGYAEVSDADRMECVEAYMDAVTASTAAEAKKEADARDLKIKQDSEALQLRIQKFFADDVANVKAGYANDYVYRHCLTNHSTPGKAHLDVSASDAAVCKFIAYGNK